MDGMKVSLHRAALLNRGQSAEQILQRDPTCVNDYDRLFDTAFHKIYKVEGQHPIEERTRLSQLLLDYGANINAQSGLHFLTPLYNAIHVQEPENVAFLLEKGADPNLLDCVNKTVLFFSNRRSSQSVRTIKKLLLHPAINPNVIDDFDYSPLVNAAEEGRLDLMRLLMKAGAKTLYLKEVLIFAIRKRNVEMIKFVLKNRETLDTRINSSLKALYLTVDKDKRITKPERRFFNQILKEEGFNIHELSHEEMTDLHLAVEEEDELRVIFLLRNGASVDARNTYGNTPLHCALQKVDWSTPTSQMTICRFLIIYGADMNARNHFNKTAFQLAVDAASPFLLKLILSKKTGVDLTKIQKNNNLREWYSRNSEYKKTLHELSVAVILGEEEIINILIKRGNPTELSRDSSILSKHPLGLSIEAHNYRISQLLLEAGFNIKGYFSSRTPVLKSGTTKVTDDALKLACLLWEYDSLAVITRSMMSSSLSMIENRIMNNLRELFIFILALEIRLNRLDKQFVPMKGFLKTPSLEATLSDCNRKLDCLSNIAVGKLTRLDILSWELNRLVKYLNFKENLDAFKELRDVLETKDNLECDEYLLKHRVTLALEKRQLWDFVKDILHDTWRRVLEPNYSMNLPDEILWNIVEFMNMRTLRILSGNP